MDIKQELKNHPILAYATLAIVSFIAGWTAHIAVQSESGLVPISKSEHDRLKTHEQKLLERSDQAELLTLRAEADELRKTVLQNKLHRGSYISNVILTPKSPAILKVGEKVIVGLGYFLAEGKEAAIYVQPEFANGRFSMDGSTSYRGSGTLQREFTVKNAGKLNSILISISNDKEVLYEMRIPVKYLFR